MLFVFMSRKRRIELGGREKKLDPTLNIPEGKGRIESRHCYKIIFFNFQKNERNGERKLIMPSRFPFIRGCNGKFSNHSLLD